MSAQLMHGTGIKDVFAGEAPSAHGPARVKLAPARVTAILPTTLAEIETVARQCVLAGIGSYLPGDSDDTRLAKAIAAIMSGAEVGLPPIAAVQNIKVDQGRCLIWGDAVPALLWAAGFKIEQTLTGQYRTRCATCRVTRPDGTVIERQFNVTDALRIRVWDERPVIPDGAGGLTPNTGYWYLYPDRMLGYRALGFAVKDGAPDVMRGLYVREEYDPAINARVDAPAPGPARASAGVSGAPSGAVPPKAIRLSIPDDVDPTPPSDHASGSTAAAGVSPGTAAAVPLTPDAVIREIERAVSAGTDPALIEAQWICAINGMVQEDRDLAFAILYPDR